MVTRVAANPRDRALDENPLDADRTPDPDAVATRDGARAQGPRRDVDLVPTLAVRQRDTRVPRNDGRPLLIRGGLDRAVARRSSSKIWYRTGGIEREICMDSRSEWILVNERRRLSDLPCSPLLTQISMIATHTVGAAASPSSTSGLASALTSPPRSVPVLYDGCIVVTTAASWYGSRRFGSR